MHAPRILILYNEPVLPAGHPDAASEREVLDIVEVVDEHLSAAGYDVCRLGAGHDPVPVVKNLRRLRPDAVFNLFEGTADDGINEVYMGGLLEWMKIPFTGCPAHAMGLARNKQLTKTLLRGAGLPTPAFCVVDCPPFADGANLSEDVTGSLHARPKSLFLGRNPRLLSPFRSDSRLRWPIIVKPAAQDASVGIDQESVVSDKESLNRRIVYVLERYGPPVLLEEFIRGRELNVSIITVPTFRALPISEILFANGNSHAWPIVTYAAKWKPGSEEDLATRPHCPADLAPALAREVQRLARQAFQLLGCRDYARVDLRLSTSGRPYILEVNPNPDLHPSAGLEGSLAAAGISHADFTVELVEAALRRKENQALNSAVL